MSLKQQLKSGNKKIGIWGLGYIGFSSLAYFARAGITCIGNDVIPARIDDVNQGHVTIPNFNFWLGFDPKPLAEHGQMRATLHWEELVQPEVAVHLIAVPTEMNGKPHHDILKDVITKLSKYKDIKTDTPPLVIVESTLTPTVADQIVIPLFEKHGLIVGKDILLGVAPRRDWFTAPDKTLKLLPRVVGGTTPETNKLMKEALSIICDTIIEAHDHKHAALVKSVENAYRQLGITFVNQLSLAYPDIDITSVMKMASTKWNVNLYHPSFGTGGYCIPLAKTLQEQGMDVKVHDPYYNAEEIKKLTGSESFVFPQGLHDRDTILLVTPHMNYKYTNKQEILKYLNNTKLVIDNMGIWNDFPLPEKTQYFEAGHANWLE